MGSGANASALRIADLDCDGALDLATTVVVGGRRDAVLLRRSGLTFEAPVLLGFSDARDVLVADPLCALGQPVLFVALADVPTVIVLLPVLDRG